MTSKRQQQEEAGKWLRRAREQRGLRTTGALARLMGVSDSLVSRIETGVTAATDERAEQIAEALGLDIIEVRRNLGLWVPPDEPAGDASPMDEAERMLDEAEKIARQLRSLPPPDRDVVEAMIERLTRRAETPGDTGNDRV